MYKFTNEDWITEMYRRNMFTNSIPTPYDLGRRMIENLVFSKNSKILVMHSPDIALVLTDEFKVPPRRITVYGNGDKNIPILCAQKGFKYLQTLEDEIEIQYDAMIGHVPYSRNASREKTGRVIGNKQQNHTKPWCAEMEALKPYLKNDCRWVLLGPLKGQQPNLDLVSNDTFKWMGWHTVNTEISDMYSVKSDIPLALFHGKVGGDVDVINVTHFSESHNFAYGYLPVYGSFDDMIILNKYFGMNDVIPLQKTPDDTWWMPHCVHRYSVQYWPPGEKKSHKNIVIHDKAKRFDPETGKKNDFLFFDSDGLDIDEVIEKNSRWKVSRYCWKLALDFQAQISPAYFYRFPNLTSVDSHDILLDKMNLTESQRDLITNWNVEEDDD